MRMAVEFIVKNILCALLSKGQKKYRLSVEVGQLVTRAGSICARALAMAVGFSLCGAVASVAAAGAAAVAVSWAAGRF